MSTIPTQPVSAVVRSTTQVCIFSFLDPCLFLHSADQRPRSSFNENKQVKLRLTTTSLKLLLLFSMHSLKTKLE